LPLTIFRLLLGRHQGDLLEGMGGRRLLGHEPKLQMVDDPVHGGKDPPGASDETRQESRDSDKKWRGARSKKRRKRQRPLTQAKDIIAGRDWSLGASEVK